MKKRCILLFIFSMLLSVIAFPQTIVALRIDPLNGQAGVCKGAGIQLTASPTFSTGAPLVNYRWYPSNLFGADSTANPVFPKPTATTIFKVKAWVDGETPKEAFLTVIVNEPPKVNIISTASNSNCTNIPVTVLGTAENYKNVPRWSSTGTGMLVVKDPLFPLNSVYIPAANQTGTAVVTLTVDPLDYCSSASFSKSISLTFVETPAVSIQTPDGSICSFEKFPISATASNYDSFTWKIIGGTGSFLNGDKLNPTYVPGSNDKGKTRIVLEARKNECYNYDTLNVNVISMNTHFTPDPAEFCKGLTADLGVTPDSASYTYLWSTGATTSKISISPFQNTSYWVQVTNKLCSTSFKDTVNVTVLDNPVIDEINDKKEFHTIEILPDGQYYSFTVNDNVEKEGRDNSFDYLPFFGLADTVYISATLKNICPSADTIYIIIEPGSWVNAFSPNGDGTNDSLLPGRRTTVFDRTGKVMYDGWDGWDGIYNGKKMPIGTYFYVLYNMKNKIIYKGPVTLLRDSINK
jgi:gliding motility-associated-like protein